MCVCVFFFLAKQRRNAVFFSLLMFALHSFDTSPKSRVDHARNIVHLHSYTFLRHVKTKVLSGI